MAFLRSHRLLLLLVALLFAGGHAHQVFGRFESHHYGAGVGEHRHDHHGAHEGDHGDAEKDARHMMEHHAFACVEPAVMLMVFVVLDSVALGDVSAPSMPEAPVAGIDYPPQLIG